MVKEGYHHGDLRRALLDAAAQAIEEQGPAALSLRALARRAGVSHAAPTHHFGDKAGLLTALAEEGYGRLADELTAEWAASRSFVEQGVAYVRFARRHRAHFEVMFRPDLYNAGEPGVVAARERARQALYAGVAEARAMVGGQSGAPEDATAPDVREPAGGAGEGQPAEIRAAGLAAWSIAHGFAALSTGGALQDLPGDPDEIARIVLSRLPAPDSSDAAD